MTRDDWNKQGPHRPQALLIAGRGMMNPEQCHDPRCDRESHAAAWSKFYDGVLRRSRVREGRQVKMNRTCVCGTCQACQQRQQWDAQQSAQVQNQLGAWRNGLGMQGQLGGSMAAQSQGATRKDYGPPPEPKGDDWRCECTIEGGGRADGRITKLCPAHLRSYTQWAANEKAAEREKIRAEARAETLAATNLVDRAKLESANAALAEALDDRAAAFSAASVANERAMRLADVMQTVRDENTALLAENARLRRKLEGKR